MSFAVALHLAEVVPTTLLGVLAIWRLGLHFDRMTMAAAAAEASGTEER